MDAAARVEIMKKLHVCPEPFREVLYLRIFGNLSFREIGEIMEKTENWARVTFYRGKEKLREELIRDEE
jgi:RNA polymerase sigma-70 factor (ECF subfamily)